MPGYKWGSELYGVALEVLSPSNTEWKNAGFGATWGEDHNHNPQNFNAVLVYKWNSFDLYVIK